jgi:MSHA biogenesis protein MshE
VGPVRPGIRNITEILLEAGVVDEMQVQAALEHQRGAGIRVGEALVELGAANEHDIGWALARQLGLSFVELRAESLDRELVRTFPSGALRRLLAVPLVRQDHALSAAFGDPTDRDAILELERLAGRRVVPNVAAPSEIHHVLDVLAEEDDERRARPAARANGAYAPRATVMREGSGAHVLSEQVQRAVSAGATEIHYLPEGETLRILHRIQGRLVPAGSAPAGLVYPLLARLDALGGPVYDGEQTHAQGRAVCRVGEEELLLDVSLLGVEGGLAMTLGLRSARRTAPSLEELGLEPVEVACIRAILDEPAALVLVCGPPRSGCSTTLASLLAAVPAAGRRAIAFERLTGTPLECLARLKLPPDVARRLWGEIVVGQNADVVALDDVFTGEHVQALLASEASGRLVLASTDWSDTFALLEFLTRRPGGGTILADRLRLVVQQRMASRATSAAAAPPAPDPPATEFAPRPVFEPLFVGDALRAALREGVPGARLREVAMAGGFRERSAALDRAPEGGPPRLGAREPGAR